MKVFYLGRFYTLKAIASLFIFILAQTSVRAQAMSCKDPVIESGTELALGTTYRFRNVTPTAGALVTVDNSTSGFSLLLIKARNTGSSFPVFPIPIARPNSIIIENIYSLESTIPGIERGTEMKEFTARVIISNSSSCQQLDDMKKHVGFQVIERGVDVEKFMAA